MNNEVKNVPTDQTLADGATPLTSNSKDDFDATPNNKERDPAVCPIPSKDCASLMGKYASIFNLSFIAVVSNIGTLLFGYELGSTSFLIMDIDNESSSNDDTSDYYHLVADSSYLMGFVAAAASLGATLTYPFLMVFGNNISKKDEIILAALFFFVGALLESTSGEMDWSTADGLVLLLIGRIVYGAGIATSFHAIPQYIIETVPDDLRGQFGSSTEAMAMTGTLMGFGIGYLFEFSGEGWADTYRFAYIISIFMAVCALFIPNSAAWMLKHHYPDDEVLDSLQFIYPGATLDTLELLKGRIAQDEKDQHIVEAQLEETVVRHNNSFSILAMLNITQKTAPSLLLVLSNRTLARNLTVSLTIMSMIVVSGQVPILYYAPTIFADFYSDKVEILVLGFIIVKATVAYAMVFLADSFGRRELFGASSLMMSLSLFLLGVCYAANFKIASIVFLYTYAFSFEFAFGTMVWPMINELFPGYVRSTAIAISANLLFFLFLVFTFILPAMEAIVGFSALFFFFSVANIAAFCFVHYLVPETRDVELEDAYKCVDKYFDNAPAWCCCGKSYNDYDQSGQLSSGTRQYNNQDRQDSGSYHGHYEGSNGGNKTEHNAEETDDDDIKQTSERTSLL